MDAPLDRAGVEGSIRAGLAHLARHGTQHWAVMERGSPTIIGCCGLNLFEGGPDFELVFHFVPGVWGRGYATEAARAVTELGFTRFSIPRIVAGHHPDNHGSQRVLEKLGFASL